MSPHVSSTLFVRNLPYSATKQDLEAIFEDVGPLKQCFVVTDKGVTNKCRGFGYVTFALREDAEKAVKASSSLQGRKLKVHFASNKKPTRDPSWPSSTVGKETEEVKQVKDGKRKPSESQKEEKEPPEKGEKGPPEEEVKGPPAKKEKKKNKKNKKEVKESLKLKEAERERRRCRLIVRNLPFKCSDETLKSTFESFGAVSEVSIPVKEKTSKKLGFGFVQFENLKAAAKAVKQMNGKKIMGRVVAVDWTLPRAEYLEAMKTAKQELSEEENDEEGDEEEEEEEDSDEGDEEDSEMEVEKDNDEEENEEMDESEDVSDEDASDELKEDASDDDGEEEAEDDDEEEEEEERKSTAAKPKQVSEDVHEGKTLFIRNVPFESTDDDVREIFSPFGNLEMCRVVIDPMTEHSRGTAFVKFSRKEDAEECLKESDALRLSSRLLSVSPAISRSEAIRLRTAEKEKAKEEQKDKRNLHLLREGMIRPGTKAAEGLSELYLNKRQKVENVKKEKLKNLNVFVSPTRLAVHNLPKAVDDKRLRELAREAAGDKKAKVIEAKIMRDLQSPNSQGICKSLGFGFIEFTHHTHALNTLLHLNNNKDLFGPEKRPIVGFSLENRRALEIKEKRREKARMRQGMFSKDDGPKTEEEKPPVRKPYSQQRLQQTTQQQQQQGKKAGAETQLHGKAAMVMPQEGKKKGLPRHFGAKNRWRDRGKVADEKRKQRKEKRMVLQKQVWSSMKDPRPEGGLQVSKKELRREKQKNQKKKQGQSQREEKQFNAMVNRYKQKLTRTSGAGEKKGNSKWFDT